MTITDETHQVAVILASAFRDKFDYSEDGHFDKLAEISWKAAAALLRKRDAVIAEIAKTEADKAKEAAAKAKLGGGQP